MVGGRRFRIATIDFDTSYPTGGEAVTAANFDLPTAITGIALLGITDGADVVHFTTFDAENSKILCHAPGGAQIADTTDLSGVSAKYLVIGY
jgi:hypothetical protein